MLIVIFQPICYNESGSSERTKTENQNRKIEERNEKNEEIRLRTMWICI